MINFSSVALFYVPTLNLNHSKYVTPISYGSYDMSDNIGYTMYSMVYPSKTFQVHGKSCWVAGWGQSQSNGVSSDSLKSIGVNLFNHQYCNDHRFIFFLFF